MIQAIRKLKKHIEISNALKKTANVLDEGTAQRADTFTPIAQVDPKSYPVYNTEMEEKNEYELKEKEGATEDELKVLLLKRGMYVYIYIKYNDTSNIYRV